MKVYIANITLQKCKGCFNLGVVISVAELEALSYENFPFTVGYMVSPQKDER